MIRGSWPDTAPCTHAPTGAEQKQEVVGHLDVVRLEMEPQTTAATPASPHLSSERQHHATEYPWHGGDGANLRGVAGGQIQHVQRRQAKSHPTSNASQGDMPKQRPKTYADNMATNTVPTSIGMAMRTAFHVARGAVSMSVPVI